MTDLEYIKKYYNGNIEDAIKRLNNGEPVQYIVGNVNFYGNNLIVNKNVLIPRFETEELVEKTINYIKNYFNKDISILDIGTGSGCIAITLKKELSNSFVDAVDVSSDALKIAKINAKNNQVDINFYKGNLFEPINKKYDVIVSNPPYIDYNEEIMDIVKNNEPNIALYAPNNGLFFYEEILKKCRNYLNKKSLIAFEIGYMQGAKIKELASKYLPDAKFILEKDLSGKDRFVFIINS